MAGLLRAGNGHPVGRAEACEVKICVPHHRKAASSPMLSNNTTGPLRSLAQTIVAAVRLPESGHLYILQHLTVAGGRNADFASVQDVSVNVSFDGKALSLMHQTLPVSGRNSVARFKSPCHMRLIAETRSHSSVNQSSSSSNVASDLVQTTHCQISIRACSERFSKLTSKRKSVQASNFF